MVVKIKEVEVKGVSMCFVDRTETNIPAVLSRKMGTEFRYPKGRHQFSQKLVYWCWNCNNYVMKEHYNKRWDCCGKCVKSMRSFKGGSYRKRVMKLSVNETDALNAVRFERVFDATFMERRMRRDMKRKRRSGNGKE
jgi:hypothetical protein